MVHAVSGLAFTMGADWLCGSEGGANLGHPHTAPVCVPFAHTDPTPPRNRLTTPATAVTTDMLAAAFSDGMEIATSRPR